VDDTSKLYEEISKETGLPVLLIRHIVQHQFSFVRKTMQNGLLDNILLHNFGSFKVKKGRIDFLIRSLIKKIRKGTMDYTKGTQEIKKLWEIRKKK
jgi:hypothetical protein